jgi:hypothetical protein
MEFYQTFKKQVELLPRVTIIYNNLEFGQNGFALEWLWFGVFVSI